MVGTVPVGIGTYVHIIDEDLSIFHMGVAVLHISPAFAESLHLGPGKDNPRLIGVFYEVVAPCQLVLAYNLFQRFLFFFAITNPYNSAAISHSVSSFTSRPGR